MRRNIFPANDNYRVRAYENLLSQIQMELSFKRKGFSNFIVPFLESTSNFKHFETKDDSHSYFISDITDCERVF